MRKLGDHVRLLVERDLPFDEARHELPDARDAVEDHGVGVRRPSGRLAREHQPRPCAVEEGEPRRRAEEELEPDDVAVERGGALDVGHRDRELGDTRDDRCAHRRSSITDPTSYSRTTAALQPIQPATRTVATPPDTTETVAPSVTDANSDATSPASSSPSCGPPMKK